MPKRADNVETIIYKGIEFRRYPESRNWADKSYYRPNYGHIRRGVKTLHVEIWQDAHGPVPEGCHIHHKDGNPTNNALDNLECLTAGEHTRYHKEHYSEEQREWARKHAEEIRPLAAAWHRSQEGRAFHFIIGGMAYDKAEYKTYTCEQCGNEFQSRDLQTGHARFCSNNCKSAARRKSGADNETRICKQCSNEFTCNRYAKLEFCSKQCAVKWRYPDSGDETLQCPICKKMFTINKSAHRECCSRGCANTLRRLRREAERQS